jgi:hypothetical protein
MICCKKRGCANVPSRDGHGTLIITLALTHKLIETEFWYVGLFWILSQLNSSICGNRHVCISVEIFHLTLQSSSVLEKLMVALQVKKSPFLWNLKVHYCVQDIPPLNPTLSQTCLIHTYTLISLDLLYFHLWLGLQNGLFLSHSLTTIWKPFLLPEVAEWVTLLLRIREVPFLNFGPETGYSDRFSCFSSVRLGTAGIVPKVRPWSQPSTYCSIHHSLITLSFDYSELLRNRP